MKKSTIHKLTRLIFMVLTAALFFNAASAQTNFSGKWARNDGESNANGISINSIPTMLEISQDATGLSIKRTSRNGSGVVNSYTEVLKFDGSTSETITPSKLKRIATVKWSADKTSLTENFVSKDDQGNVMQSGIQVFTLDNNGKTLKVKASQDYDGQDTQL